MKYLEQKPTIYKTALLSVAASTVDKLQRELPESIYTSGDNGLFVDMDQYTESGNENALLEEIIEEARLDMNEISTIHFFC